MYIAVKMHLLSDYSKTFDVHIQQGNQEIRLAGITEKDAYALYETIKNAVDKHSVETIR